jgi:uncharacterized protein
MSNPFEFHIGDLRSGRSEPRTVSTEVPVEWRLELSRVLPSPPLYFDLELAPIAGGISVMGVVEATVAHRCRRCLTDWTEDVLHHVTQVITITGDDEDEYILRGDLFDFEDLVRDELMLSLPIAPSCGPDCTGLVVEERNDLNTDFSEQEAASNSPFSVLRDLLDNGE